MALALPRTFALPDGTELRTEDADDEPRAAGEGSLVGPPGGWRATPPATSSPSRYDGEQARLDPIGAADLDETARPAVSEALRRAHAALPTGRAPEAHRLVVDAIGAEPACFAVPVAPVTELLAAADLGVREAWVGPVGEPWQTPAEQARRRQLDQLLAGAERCCRQAARRTLDAWQAWMAEPTIDDGSSFSIPRSTAPPPSGWSTTSTTAPPPPSWPRWRPSGGRCRALRRLGDWATRAGRRLGGNRAGVEYLRAVGADAAGDAATVEAHLRAGLEADADNAACLLLLAELTQDRGDAERSLELLRRAGRPPGPDELRALQPFLVDRRVGRERALPLRLGPQVQDVLLGPPDPSPVARTMPLAAAQGHPPGDRRMYGLEVESMRRFFAVGEDDQQATGLAEDMVLFGRGGLGRYLTARGPLLPDDELACAQGLAGPADAARRARGRRRRRHGRCRGHGRRRRRGHGGARWPSPIRPAGRFAAGDTVLARLLPVEDAMAARRRRGPGAGERARRGACGCSRARSARSSWWSCSSTSRSRRSRPAACTCRQQPPAPSPAGPAPA